MSNPKLNQNKWRRQDRVYLRKRRTKIRDLVIPWREGQREAKKLLKIHMHVQLAFYCDKSWVAVAMMVITVWRTHKTLHLNTFNTNLVTQGNVNCVLLAIKKFIALTHVCRKLNLNLGFCSNVWHPELRNNNQWDSFRQQPLHNFLKKI